MELIVIAFAGTSLLMGIELCEFVLRRRSSSDSGAASPAEMARISRAAADGSAVDRDLYDQAA